MRSLGVALAVASAAYASPLRGVPGLGMDRAAMSAAPLALNTSEFQFVLDASIALRGDWDAVSVDISQYGVPWNSFLYQEPLPVSWSERLDAMVKGVDSYELPVILSFSALGSDKHSCPSNNASDYPGTASPDVPDFRDCTKCFDFDLVRNPVASFVRQAYINYALAVSYAFNTTGTLAVIDFGKDSNRYLEDGCSDAQWLAYKQFTQQIYVTLKELYPPRENGGVSVYASISIETMLGVQNGQACQNVNWNAARAPAALVACAAAGFAALEGIPYDAFAFSSVPALPTGARAAGPPAWYLPTALAALPASERASLVVAATGFPADPLALNFANTSDFNPPLQCETLLPSSGAKAAAWFESVIAATSAPGYHAFIINFRAARDVLFDAAMACPCTYPTQELKPFCDVLVAYRGACKAAGLLPAACELAIKISGALGVRDLFGNPREPLFSALQAYRAQA